ncbi:F-box protein SKIP14-like [Impatiens glandulifera]|uniref:F-box protein SKIP14-like n=1 Tax=Impatiens glandulifera TaxID=253017 RepID=UPI001FB138B6|nr:F-box protein SKIP14-like [Impatiens glandulifera]
MALNFSHRPIFSSHLSEDNYVSPARMANGYLMEGIQENSDRCGSPESVSKDVIDRLPSDPFDMDITTTFTAITGWLEDLEVDYGGFGRNVVVNNAEEYNLFTGLNLIWTNVLRFQPFPSNTQFSHIVPAASPSDGWINETEVVSSSSSTSINHVEETQEESVESCGVAHEAFLYSLGSLGVRDLLSVERVCKSLRSSVQTDILLWRNIVIDQPLNEKITDDALFELTSRAQGTLHSLSLVECPRITDDGLKRVLETNLQLTKLSVPGCTRLSVEGIVSTLKTLKSEGTLCLKHLRMGGLYGMTENHFEELKLLLGTNKVQNDREPRYYDGGHHYVLCDDDYAIDIEECPKCQKLRIVYDCPVEGCQGQSGNCRGCILCIPRCVECGCCINDSEYEETFCLEWLCSDCSSHQLPIPTERLDDNILPLDDNVLSQESS